MDRIKTICVLPAADSKHHHHNIKEELENFAVFLESKISEYEKALSDTSAVVFTANVLQNRVASWEFAVQLTKIYEAFGALSDTSAVVFTANVLQNRVASWEFAVQLTKIYEAFGVRRSDEFAEKFEQMRDSNDTSNEIKALITKVIELFDKWDFFLKTIDGELEKAVGSQSLQEIAAQEDEIHLAKRSNSLKHGTLKSFIKESAYDMTLITVIVSFSSPESAEHTLRMYENLNEFQKYGCDVLMLTKEDIGTGGGFLKIVGVPFRQLMGEQEALSRLLQYRQSAISLAGSKALHMFTEIICNDETLAMSDGPSALQNNSACAQISTGGGTILVDKSGQVLYSYIGTDKSDWPDVAVLLENVRNYRKPQKNCPKKSEKSTNDFEKKKECAKDEEMTPESRENKCCVIL
ncbi:Uncharacterized protein T05H10.8 [Toxocara canis]|uniref:Uncharacterized protein T05H10.8 n=1 Tax=Toxocara canis TaxID=6265 RepID=A0A0B2VG23_TOXCA|nr:Uncharacterized protein T05H10.8 [Toxocara canis]